jgi:hypothetical protein
MGRAGRDPHPNLSSPLGHVRAPEEGGQRRRGEDGVGAPVALPCWRRIAAVLLPPLLLATGLAYGWEPVDLPNAMAIAWAGWVHLGLLAMVGDPRELRDAQPGTVARTTARRVILWAGLSLGSAGLFLGPIALVRSGAGAELVRFAPVVLTSSLILLLPARGLRSWGIPGGRTFAVIAYPPLALLEMTRTALPGGPAGLLFAAALPPFSLAAELGAALPARELAAVIGSRLNDLAVYTGIWLAVIATGSLFTRWRAARQKDRGIRVRARTGGFAP